MERIQLVREVSLHPGTKVTKVHPDGTEKTIKVAPRILYKGALGVIVEKWNRRTALLNIGGRLVALDKKYYKTI